nr:MAG TPA: hypothetical protein [Caudoviricetes sp.]
MDLLMKNSLSKTSQKILCLSEKNFLKNFYSATKISFFAY